LPAGQTQTATINQAQAFANFLIGNVNNGFSQTSRNPTADMNQNIWGVFFQDNWKIKPRLTLNLGVRYDYNAPPTDASGFLNNFDPDTYSAANAPTIANNGLICLTDATCYQNGSNAGQKTTANTAADYAGVNYINGMIFGTPGANNNNQASPFGAAVSTSQKNNFAPRVGFAYDLFGDGKTALRGGYGIAYDELEVSAWETTVGPGQSYGVNPPGASTFTISQTSLDSPSGGASNSTRSTTPGHLYAVPLNTKTPYNQQYSLGLQQQFSPKLFLELGYFGTHGIHLGGQEEINQPHPGAWRGKVDPRLSNYPSTAVTCQQNGTTIPIFWNSTCDRVLNQIKPYLGYYAIDSLRTIFSANYNALQAKITLRGKGKTYIDGNFTWSRDLTNTPSNSTFIQDIYNVNGDYGRAAYDRKLIFNIDGVYELPWFREQRGMVGRLVGGWEVSGILSMASGIPYSVSSSGATAIQYNGGYAQPISYASNPGNLANDNAGLALLGSTNGGIRPDQVGNPNDGNGKALRQGHKYLNSSSLYVNTGAFVATDPNSDRPGTARRGTLNGPGYVRLDVGVFRNFRIYDRLTFQLRGEAFNAANHPNAATIGTSATSTTFGEV
ncbi:MAG: TonB-dependent receptor, partial [Acidobacteriota bacterium]